MDEYPRVVWGGRWLVGCSVEQGCAWHRCIVSIAAPVLPVQVPNDLVSRTQTLCSSRP